MYSNIQTAINQLASVEIPNDRKETLQPLVEFIQTKVANKEAIRLNFICTHNSRRSVLCQVWAQALALHFKVDNVTTYSGGTEDTAVFASIISTLEDTGFEITNLTESKNSIYCIKYSENEHPIIGFSKHYDADFNPASNFAAIMTCSQADGNCPFIPGAEKRIPITFEDPKKFDGTSQQAEKYKERSLQIASEMHYVFSQLTTK